MLELKPFLDNMQMLWEKREWQLCVSDSDVRIFVLSVFVVLKASHDNPKIKKKFPCWLIENFNSHNVKHPQVIAS